MSDGVVVAARHAGDGGSAVVTRREPPSLTPGARKGEYVCVGVCLWGLWGLRVGARGFGEERGA